MEHQGAHKNSFRNARAFQDRIGIWKCWFLRRWENRSTRRKHSRSRVENQQQTQPTYGAGSGNRTRDTLVEGEHSHHCAIPAPLMQNQLPFDTQVIPLCSLGKIKSISAINGFSSYLRRSDSVNYFTCFFFVREGLHVLIKFFNSTYKFTHFLTNVLKIF